MPQNDPFWDLWTRFSDHPYFRWGIAYALVAINSANALEICCDAFGWPKVVLRYLILALVVILIVAVTFALKRVRISVPMPFFIGALLFTLMTFAFSVVNSSNLSAAFIAQHPTTPSPVVTAVHDPQPDSPDPSRDCEGFFRTLARDAPWLPQQGGDDAAAFWGSIASYDALLSALKNEVDRFAPPPGAQALDEPNRWRAVLWQRCRDLRKPAVESEGRYFERFTWLTEVYSDVLGLNCTQVCPPRGNAMKVWLMWTAYNHRMFDKVIELANEIDNDSGGTAERRNKAYDGEIPADDQDAFARGPLNDVAAARWLSGEALQQLGRLQDANAAFDSLMCVNNGMTVGPTGGFSRPADRYARNHSCRETRVL
ncbi:MAG: hypothetical protein ABSD74_15310 [Rhizomicrobium sp.]|jgi:hypothetical protein